ncbi:MAG: Hsp20/alpha crystallin family protein [Burkholderiaceae bacterium]
MPRLSLYDPFADVFPELFRGMMAPAGPENGKPLEIRIDVSETDAEYKVSAEVPGVAKEDIQVQIDGNRVAISAEVSKEKETREGERVLRSERYRGSVSRSFALASEIDEERASAAYENGILNLVLPKKVAAGAKRLKIG